ncbi:hypothetical protein Patl1_31886 [Pistacia atlantica]|uniref:Uncharacterized protein n=1 Tax=Pistacia atlantica TaxID=434234 RepID=A0ACC1AM89_9ROSI|nr:hypothetical protein Patl1_31886 [Pistacia atlantica]
MRRGSLSFLR